MFPELNHKRPLLWREIAKQIPGRSNKDCRKRWWNSLAGATAKGAWSPEEDRRLFDAVQKYGTNSWMKVAGAVGTRYGDQCSSHWLHVLNPNINYSDWTPEEVSTTCFSPVSCARADQQTDVHNTARINSCLMPSTVMERTGPPSARSIRLNGRHWH